MAAQEAMAQEAVAVAVERAVATERAVLTRETRNKREVAAMVAAPEGEMRAVATVAALRASVAAESAMVALMVDRMARMRMRGEEWRVTS